ncbi:MAG TPA: trypsin-like serine protease, partial [Polyangiaceae bacterium]|nr:trypsin-like serine protease [Polyangiaceae bacterium]
MGSVCALAALACGALTGCAAPASENVAQSDSPIIGGKLDTADKGVVSLLKQVQGGYYPACSGTLLTQNLVLTAHHCVAELSSADGASVDCTTTQFQNQTLASRMLISVEANVGTDGLNPFKVAQVWVPPGDSSVCGRDVALLLLSGSGVPAGSAKPIEPSLTRQLAANEVFA